MPDLSLVCIGCVFVETGTRMEGVIVDVKGFEEGNMIIGAGGETVFGGETFSRGETVFGMGKGSGISVVCVGKSDVEGRVGVVVLDEVCGLCEGWEPNIDG